MGLLKKTVLEMFDRGIEIEQIAKELRIAQMSVRMLVWMYRSAKPNQKEGA